MENYYPDLFNDVFGPIMQPGSSSHTAGPCRIGNLANQLLESKIKKITIRLDQNGSFSGTFGHMNEDLGMLAGAYGLMPDDEKMFDIREILEQEKITYEFVFTDLKSTSHPNGAEFELIDSKNHKATLVGNSTGGGMVETVEIMGCPYHYVGDCFLSCIRSKSELPLLETDDILSGQRGVFEITRQHREDNGYYYFFKSEAPLQEFVSDLKEKADITVYQLKPILPVPATEKRKPQLFQTFDEWIAAARKHHINLAQAAVLYEINSSGWEKQDIMEYMKRVKVLMKRQTQAVYENDEKVLQTPFSGYHYKKWESYQKDNTPLAGNVVSLAIHYALGVQALIRGVKMVPGPMGTGGGYLYAAVRAVQETRHFSEEKVLEALFVAAGVGAICYTRTNPTGEVVGCAGECGVCGAMAAAAITFMAGGTDEQIEAAASLTLQAAVGWPCDPIPGGDNQPCLSRVLTMVTMAITFSDMALSGREAVLPFHEVVDAVAKMGEEMPVDLKCTSQGGLCDTPCGKRCRKEFEKWRTSFD